MKISRSIPYFNALLKASSHKRMEILHAFPSFVLDDLIEVLYNVVLGRVDIGRKSKNLLKHKKALVDIVNTKSKSGKRALVYNMKGGFLGALLPIILGVTAKALA